MSFTTNCIDNTISGNLEANKSEYVLNFSCMSFKVKSIDGLYEKIKSIVELSNEDEGVSVKIGTGVDSGIIKIYTQDTDILKRASSGLFDLLELSYSTAEHHPYWAILYNATEILKTILDKWQLDFNKDEIIDMSWRIDEMKSALHKIDTS
jgi:hypothetical protein